MEAAKARLRRFVMEGYRHIITTRRWTDEEIKATMAGWKRKEILTEDDITELERLMNGGSGNGNDNDNDNDNI